VTSGLPPSSLVVEITESTLLSDSALRVLHDLRELGVRVAVDDFGVGYSSLSYLQRFPIDVLKVDRSFVAGAGSGSDGVIARAIVDIGSALGLQVVAEGIEHVAQVAALRSFGCKLGQGFLFAEPLDAGELETLILAPTHPWDEQVLTPVPPLRSIAIA
jgi:EAL domain-containing protein (putative c-di-GMP-specific phosphodiesterase class I)